MTADGEPEVWLVDLVEASVALEALEGRSPRLPDDEIVRAASLGSREAARAWRAAHLALRVLLERHVGAELCRAPLTRDRNGKPALPIGAPHFSLSHSGGHGLIAIARSGPVGIDLELARAVRLSAPRRRAIVAAANGLAPDLAALTAAHERDMLQAWTRLEAFAKGGGTGLGRMLDALGLVGHRGGPAAPAAAGAAAARLIGASRLRLADLPLPVGMFGALAATGLGAPPRVRPFPVSPGAVASLAAGQ